MKSRACTNVILTGPSGHLWHVSFCCTDTSGSFRDGWKSFVCDNGILAGDILVFRHAINIHFIVQVFEASYCASISPYWSMITTPSYEEIRKTLCKSENSISQNQVPLFQKHPIRLDADPEVKSCSVTKDDSGSIPVSSFCNIEAPKFSATIQKSAVVGNY